MHRPAEPFVEAGLASEDLCERSVDQVVDGQILHIARCVLFNNAKALAAEIIAHDLHQRVVVQLLDRRQTFGKNLTVGTVRSVNVVVHIKEKRLPDSGGFLTDRQVCRSAMVVFDIPVMALLLDRIQHVFKRANDHHIALDADNVVFCDVACGQFIGHGLVVLIDRDRCELDKTALSGLGRVDHQFLGHVRNLLVAANVLWRVAVGR